MKKYKCLFCFTELNETQDEFCDDCNNALINLKTMNKKKQKDRIINRAVTALGAAVIDVNSIVVKIPVDEHIVTFKRSETNPERFDLFSIE